MAEIRAECIGRFAFAVLAEDQAATVMGATSQGVFVRSASGWIIFCSSDTYRGPLTITFGDLPDQLRMAQPGSSARISWGRLIFPAVDVSVWAGQGSVWQPGPVSGAPRPVLAQLNTLGYLAGEAVSSRGDVGISTLLPHLLGLPEPGGISSDWEAALESVLLARQALRDRNVPAVVARLTDLLGVGRGLTPSGDDFTVGLLLTLNRWQAGSWPDDGLRQLNRQVIRAAYQKTTRLSANLIECAALGEADERLVAVVDCIFAGEPPEAECVLHMLGWGASSGTDALTGMAVAVTC